MVRQITLRQGCFINHDRIGAGTQTTELVEAINICHCGCEYVALIILQVNRDSGNARLSCVLQAILVQVVPDKVAEAAGTGVISKSMLLSMNSSVT